MASYPSVSVIVTTYNWPQALNRVLISLCQQKYEKLEVIVADDGSGEQTSEIIQDIKLRTKISIRHCWQPDEGFRAAMIRNRAVALARHEYLIFIDGDCIPSPNFILNHVKLAQKGWFVAGSRILLNQDFSNQILINGLKIEDWSWVKWYLAYITRKCNRILPQLNLPLGGCRKWQPKKWRGAKTCNLGLYKSDFISVNGMDENFTGWGFEDSDLVIRLQKNGIFHKSGRFSVFVYHLWHQIESRAKAQINLMRLNQTIQGEQIKAIKGVDQYLEINN